MSGLISLPLLSSIHALTSLLTRAKVLAAATGLIALALPQSRAYAQWSDYQNFTIRRAGLYGPEQTGSQGLQSSSVGVLTAAGGVAGISSRYAGTYQWDNGSDAWYFDGITTSQIGLTGVGYTTNSRYQSSSVASQTAAGQIVGYSGRLSNLGISMGQDVWVFDGGTTTRAGLTEAVNISSTGEQTSSIRTNPAAPNVMGTSNHYVAFGTGIGRDVWVFDGRTTKQIGFTGEGYTNLFGHRESQISGQNASGLIIGSSKRFLRDNSNLGQDAWIFDGTAARPIGLTGPEYTTPMGSRFSWAFWLSDAGEVVGTTQRFAGEYTSNGFDCWTYDGTTFTTVGLTGPGYTGSTGFQSSYVDLILHARLLAGTTSRVTRDGMVNGQDAWVFNGTSTTPVGFTGPQYFTSTGFGRSAVHHLMENGRAAGVSSRFDGANEHNNGTDAWFFDGVTTRQIGLVGGVYTGSEGYQYSSVTPQIGNRPVVGRSRRYSGVNTWLGQDVWVFNGETTMQIGLTGGVYLGSGGYQYSESLLQNDAGHIAGSSRRYINESTRIGEDAWYADVATGVTHPVIGSVRTTDNYASSTPTILTDDGFLLGSYTYFPGGVGNGEQRAFIFRPDLGFNDLGNLIAGGLSANGWATLEKPVLANGLRTIVGYGLVTGQTSGQSVFVMTRPALGACCRGAMCSVTFETGCEGDSVRFVGDGTVCNAPGNAFTPCCKADFNQSAGVTVQDVLDFLIAWFEAAPTADFNGVGGVTVQDVLEFLSAWFTGC